MALTLKNNKSHWLLYFEQLDSTNNYAMQWVSDGMAQHGQVIVAEKQTMGRGQRDKHWENTDKDIKMSLLIQPKKDLDQIYVFSMLMALALHHALEEILPKNIQIHIKWPNDIYINDKKASGILIENVIRGNQWQWATVGIGVNISSKQDQTAFSAIGLEEVMDLVPNTFVIIEKIRESVLNQLYIYQSFDAVLKIYQEKLYRINTVQDFEVLETGAFLEAKIKGVNEKGELILIDEQEQTTLWSHGSLRWIL